jgi:UDPglucose 6-dehydrogenase
MRISVIGTGYVGLVSGACLADAGHDVICVDKDRSKVETINAARPTIHERGLPEILARTVGRRLRATTDLVSAVRDTDLTFIAVGTPAADGRIDLGQVRAVSAELGAAIGAKRGYHVIVVKSTVVPGTTDGVVRETLEQASGLRAGADFGLGMNPEFLTEGQAVQDFTAPDRIVIGGIDERTRQVLADVYAPFGAAPRIETNNVTAEFIKYASNAVLATMISFSNEIARLCTAVGDVDVVDVMKGVHESTYFTTRDTAPSPVRARITSFLGAGCGFGGSCLPKDVTALVGQGAALGVDMPVLSAVLGINASQPGELVRLVDRHFPSLRGIRVAILGIAFKPDTDDVRESPAFPVIRQLAARGAILTAYDPVARLPAEREFAEVRAAASLDEAIVDADAIVLVTRWAEFDSLAARLRAAGRDPLVVDGRRMLYPADFGRYEGIGRSAVRQEERQP